FPKTVERAYEDGVRVFIEHGPRAILTGAIARILGNRPHLVVALDPHGGSGLEPVARSVAKLWAAGIPMRLDQFVSRLVDLRRGGQPRPEPDGALLRLNAHAPDITWPESFAHAMDTDESNEQGQLMAPPPNRGFGYDVAPHFTATGVNGRSAAEVPPSSNRTAASTAPAFTGDVAASGGTMAPHPTLSLFEEVARAHADFLKEQKETHERFLALGLGVSGGLAGSPSSPREAHTPVPSVHGSTFQASSPQGSATPAVSHPMAAPSAPLVSRSMAPSAATAAPAPAPAVEPAPSARPESHSAAVSPKTKAADGPPSPVIPIAPPIDRDTLPVTPFLNREQLEIHAGGKISEIFGELFEQQDGYAVQVRMPEPPLLFADRALTIEGEPGTMKRGRVVTETDVQHDAWYLHCGRMAPGVVIESGQADLLLISWLGCDFLNKGDRAYRLLGCDLTFFGELPAPGETLTYDIHVDGHAKTGDVRLFFFHYDCYIGDRLLISVRNGQAGFFTKEELAGSGGVLWDAEDDDPDPHARLDPPPRLSTKRSFSAEEVAHWIDGKAHLCFGEGFELAACHTRTPTLPGGPLKLIDHVPVFDPEGGPWGRGYLRAESHVPVDAWFYEGHFKNDPCMPGTLMADAATQALSFTMAAMGFTMGRDGWRFEPVPGEMARFLCRGQVIPDGPHTLEYEIFIEDVIDGDMPEVYASLLCKSDGFKVFQCRRFGLRLVPDY
ncbi:MAG: beta keto-acyl synthase, partial [Gemmatimonadota bacterium]|nr:beta keto-acyl synthase [Gemmatimonadota bacterium]